MLIIKELREKAGITQAAIAENLNVTQACVAQWEKNKASPQTDKLPKLALILNCSIDELFGNESVREG